MTRRVITGFSNPTVKALRALRDKKHRRRSGRFLAEGLRLLTDAAHAAQEAGRNYITVASEFLGHDELAPRKAAP